MSSFSPILRVLLSDLIDYAGLFPPAGLGMAEAVSNFAAYLEGRDAWALGRFIVPSTRLDEFEGRTAEYFSREATAEPWRVSMLSGRDPGHDAELIFNFNERHAQRVAGRAVIDTIEGKASDPGSVERLVRSAPDGVTTYVEISHLDRLDEAMAAVAAAGGRAKIRTGAVTLDGIPPVSAVAGFIASAARHHVPFKATAGLHHPLRGEYPLTYEPDSVRGIMFGYLNIVLAAALGDDGATGEREALLDERSIKAFTFAPDRIVWRNHSFDTERLGDVRARTAMSFGSCSFTEPLDDIRALGIT